MTLAKISLYCILKPVILALSKPVSIKNFCCGSGLLITLWQIKQNHKNWKLWIQNRVKKICENVITEQWNSVTSKNNPADVAACRSSSNSNVKNLLWQNCFYEGDKDSWLKANCTKDGVVVDYRSNEKAKQCLSVEDVLVECCDSENIVR